MRDPRRTTATAAAEAEAERLTGVFLRVRMLARERGLDVFAAVAMHEGLMAAEDWRVLRRAIGN